MYNMKRIIYGILVLLVLGTLYLTLYPVPIDPGTWEAPKAPDLEGVYAQNNALNHLKVLFKGQCDGCEDIAIDTLGRIYGGAVNGDIIRFNDANSKGETLVNTGGRPLGLHFDKAQNLIIADTEKGLLSLDQNGKITVLTDSYGDYKFKFADDLEIAEDGTIYFSDATNKFGFEENILDLMEHRGNGALYAYYPDTKKTALLIDDLYFANGIAVAHDQSYVLVNETGKYWIRKYYINGPKKGQSEIFKDNLPGFPDGISKGTNGIYWVAIVSPRDEGLDQLLKQPFLRKVLLRLPESMRPAAKQYGFILGLDENAEVIYNLQDPNTSFGENTSVQEYEGYLYVGSLHKNGVGRVLRPK